MNENRYCEACGRVLEVVESNIKFNSETGSPDHLMVLGQCKQFAYKSQSSFGNGHTKMYYTIDLAERQCKTLTNA